MRKIILRFIILFYKELNIIVNKNLNWNNHLSKKLFNNYPLLFYLIMSNYINFQEINLYNSHYLKLNYNHSNNLFYRNQY